MNATANATTKTARLVDASIPERDVVVIRLGDGATLRAMAAAITPLLARPFRSRLVSYDVDAAGNRYNARAAFPLVRASAKWAEREGYHGCSACGRPCQCPEYTPDDGCMTCGRKDCPMMMTEAAAGAT